jgi:NAD-dependent SIR2 family protein deacetylase
MTHATCSECRLRFIPALAAYLPSCPTCGQPLQPLDGIDAALGFRLFRPEDGLHELPQAAAIAMPTHNPRPERQ